MTGISCGVNETRRESLGERAPHKISGRVGILPSIVLQNLHPQFSDEVRICVIKGLPSQRVLKGDHCDSRGTHW